MSINVEREKKKKGFKMMISSSQILQLYFFLFSVYFRKIVYLVASLNMLVKCVDAYPGSFTNSRILMFQMFQFVTYLETSAMNKQCFQQIHMFPLMSCLKVLFFT